MAKDRYLPGRINITYWEGDTGDIVLEFSDVVDFTSKDCRMQVRDQDDVLIFEKDSADSTPGITIDPQSDGTTVVTISMEIDDTKGHNSTDATFTWELEMYDDDEVNTLVYGTFTITKETADYE